MAIVFIYAIKYTIRQYSQLQKLRSSTKTIILIFRNLKNNLIVSRVRILTLAFLTWIAFSVIWAPYKTLAIYRLFIILGMFTFAGIISHYIKNSYIKARFVLVSLVLAGIFQSVVGISQFFLNRSVGFYFLGESILNPETSGVAKIIIENVKHIRAYGTFPHPNILAVFLVIPILILLYFFINSSLLRHRNIQKLISNETKRHSFFISVLCFTILISLFSGFLLTFSRTAFISLFLVIFTLFLAKYWLSGKKIWLIINSLFLVFAILFIVSHLYFFRTSILSTQSFYERVFYKNVAYETISTHPLIGVGIGQFVFHEYTKNQNFQGWQYQPVHNLYLLITSELGLVGLSIAILLMLTIIHNCCINISNATEKNRNELVEKCNKNFERTIYDECYSYKKPIVWDLTISPYCSLLFIFLVASFFDHYFWDIRSGMIIFLIPIIFMISKPSIGAKK
ncbi:MAG: O-antigen ligase family protein [Candidatus Pacearchaeota archaeon]